MNQKIFNTLLVCCWLSANLMAQTSWYVSQESGSNGNNGLSASTPFATVANVVNNYVQAGDTVFLMGEFVNSSYDPNYSYPDDINDPHIWTQENTIKINNLHGSAGAYITFKSYDQTTVLKGDGANILRVSNSSYLRFEDLTVEGEVDRIPYSTALALQFLYRESGSTNTLYRVPPGTSDEDVENMTFAVLNNISRPSYTDTRGIYMSNVHHIDILNNLVFNTPGNGLRVAGGDYINIIGNEVHSTSRKSYSGTHGLVVTNANSIDTYEGYKIFITNNLVHHNYNEIYSWAPSKTIITPRIDEGKGISLQRNDLANGWTHGRFLVANNITYWNGFSGVHSNTGIRMDFVNNTCYMNSYTNTITYAGQTQSGNNIGISTSSGDDIRIRNNIAVVDASWNGFAISSANTTNLEVADNLIYGLNASLATDSDVTAVEVNTTIMDPLFVDAAQFDFNLQASSPAIGLANLATAVNTDYFGVSRDAMPDVGAVEYSSALPVELLYFEALVSSDKKVLLEWATISEKDADYFEVEHSTNMTLWEVICKVSAAGNSTQRQDYNCKDTDPTPRGNYYRLKQVDIDGTITYSDIRQIEWNHNNQEIVCFPNPIINDFLTIDGWSAAAPLQLYNSQGKVIDVRNRLTEVNTQRKRLNMSGLPPGIYFLRSGSRSHSIIKVK